MSNRGNRPREPEYQGKKIYRYAGACAGFYMYISPTYKPGRIEFAAVAQAQTDDTDELYFSGTYYKATDDSFIALVSKPKDEQLPYIVQLGSWLYGKVKDMAKARETHVWEH